MLGYLFNILILFLFLRSLFSCLFLLFSCFFQEEWYLFFSRIMFLSFLLLCWLLALFLIVWLARWVVMGFFLFLFLVRFWHIGLLLVRDLLLFLRTRSHSFFLLLAFFFDWVLFLQTLILSFLSAFLISLFMFLLFPLFPFSPLFLLFGQGTFLLPLFWCFTLLILHYCCLYLTIKFYMVGTDFNRILKTGQYHSLSQQIFFVLVNYISAFCEQISAV